MLLLVSPAMGVTITATDDGGGVVTIGYTGGTGVRAFALDITVSGTDVNIASISDYKVGESNAVSKGYGIFPGKFRDFINPATPNWGDANYNPVAPVGDPDSNDVAMPSKYITVEMGSLYTGANAPSDANTLFKLHLTGTGTATLCVKTNATRGNVVKEDATEAAVTLPGTGGCIPVTIGVPPCMNSGNPSYAQWQLVKSPQCWCFSVRPRQCHGDADGKAEGRNNYWVSSGDLNVLIAAWNKPFAQIDGQSYNGVPLICADFDHNPEGRNSYRVASQDLNILIANWNQANKPDPNCPQ
jgi:hypothetical protein